MVEHVIAVQALVIALTLGLAGTWKVAFPTARSLAKQSALAILLPSPRLVSPLYLALGTAEVFVAALLVLPPTHPWAMRLAAALSLGFLIYLVVAWRVAPERPCACLGGRATPISRRSLARAVALSMGALAGWSIREYWATAFVRAPWVAAIVCAELLGLWLLSPEYSWMGRRIARRVALTTLLRLNPTCAGVTLNWQHLDQELRRTALFHQLAPFVSEHVDRWRDGCWCYFAFRAQYADRQATAVFAVPTLFDPDYVSTAVVDDTDHTVLLKLAASKHARVVGLGTSEHS
jgi:hypothetical protein